MSNKFLLLTLSLCALASPSYSRGEQKPVEENQKSKWLSWSNENRNALNEALSEATKVSGNGLKTSGSLWIGLKDNVAEIYKDKPSQDTSYIEIHIDTSQHIIKIGENPLVELEAYHPFSGGPEFFRTQKPLQLTVGDQKDRLFLEGFIRANGSNYWFLHDKKRPELHTFKQYEIYSYDYKYLVPVQIIGINSKESRVELKFTLDSTEVRMETPMYEFSFLHFFFSDHTNGNGSYSGGRMIEIELSKKGIELIVGEQLWLDLNFAYNPPCARSTAYNCGLPEVKIALPIPVGEKFSH